MLGGLEGYRGLLTVERRSGNIEELLNRPISPSFRFGDIAVHVATLRSGPT